LSGEFVRFSYPRILHQPQWSWLKLRLPELREHSGKRSVSALQGEVKTNDKHRFAKLKHYVLHMTANRASEIDL
jgi:hypothetical protein